MALIFMVIPGRLELPTPCLEGSFMGAKSRIHKGNGCTRPSENIVRDQGMAYFIVQRWTVRKPTAAHEDCSANRGNSVLMAFDGLLGFVATQRNGKVRALFRRYLPNCF
jgi:hypothetical protein